MYRWSLTAMALALAACGGENNEPNTNNATSNGTPNNATVNNTTTANNTTANNASDGAFEATGTYDGNAVSFSCSTFETSDGNILMYVGQIDTYVIQCRSTDGNYQIKLGIGAPTAGSTVDTLTAPDELSFGEINNIYQLGPTSGAPTSGSITIDSVTMGSQISGSFSGSWDGDMNVPAGECSGTFDVTLE